MKKQTCYTFYLIVIFPTVVASIGCGERVVESLYVGCFHASKLAPLSLSGLSVNLPEDIICLL